MVDNNPSVLRLLKNTSAILKDMPCMLVLEMFQKDSHLFSIPVVNHNNIPIGIVERNSLVEALIKPYAKELYAKKTILDFMNKAPLIVDNETFIDDVALMILSAGMQHMVSGFIATENGQYLGIANGHDLLNEITQMKQATLFNLAHIDQLTKLPNRRLLLDRLGQALSTSARSGRCGAILFLDLDQFKSLNDTAGHDVGDLLLKEVAARLTNCIRESDTVARLGGDEFVVILEDLSPKQIEAATQTEVIGQKILHSLSQPYQLGTYNHLCTASIGATLFNQHDRDVEEIIKKADIAMYQVKSGGRNALRFFDPQMQEVITSRVDMAQELRQALLHKQFELHYQIQVDSTARPLGAEALIRWNHPRYAIISPKRFIQLAEQTGLILPIGQWVLETACAQLILWQQNPASQHLVLSINVSAKQFHQTKFVAETQETVQRYGIDPTKLKLELTESMLVDDFPAIVAKMNTLSALGIRFSLDDFGTGYSSLQYLKKLPLSQLKIDQSFVRDITIDPSDYAITRTIIAMARSLDLGVIAEGVETEEQMQCLLEIDCTQFQGYLFGKPMPIEVFDALLK